MVTKERILLLLTLVGVIALKVGTLEGGWAEALTPQFLGASIGEVIIAARLAMTKDKWNGRDRRHLSRVSQRRDTR